MLQITSVGIAKEDSCERLVASVSRSDEPVMCRLIDAVHNAKVAEDD